MMDFICVTFGGKKRWVNVAQISALEEDQDLTFIYLNNNPTVHIECDQTIGEVMRMIIGDDIEDS